MANRNPVATRLSQVSWNMYLIGLGLIALTYRLLQWQQLPPGLSTSEASSGVLAHKIASGASAVGFHPASGYSPLWESMQAATISLFGANASSLRIVAVIVGSAAVITTYGWARSWYDRRRAWVAAFLVAVLPWSVTLSRNGISTIFAVLAVTSLLWSITEIMNSPSSVSKQILFAVICVLSVLAGPWGWLSIVSVLVSTALQRKLVSRIFSNLGRRNLTIGLSVTCLGLIAITAVFVAPTFSKLVASFGFSPVSHWPISALRVSSMFFYHGDADSHHNLGGEPMLNAFIALAFVAGLLLSLSRIQRARDRILVVLLGIGLTPAIISSGLIPNSSRAALALPIVAVLAAIGTFYLLDLWCATFPINSAARSLGQTAIALLLVLTAFQCYTQYFTAWANSSETYIAYNRPATSAANYLKSLKPGADLTFIGVSSEEPVIEYLLSKNKVQFISPEKLKTLETGKPRRLVISAGVHDAVVTTLQDRFPGGTLKAHLDRDGSELFYDYIISK